MSKRITAIVPIVLCALGIKKKETERNIKQFPGSSTLIQLQKITLQHIYDGDHSPSKMEQKCQQQRQQQQKQ